MCQRRHRPLPSFALTEKSLPNQTAHSNLHLTSSWMWQHTKGGQVPLLKLSCLLSRSSYNKERNYRRECRFSHKKFVVWCMNKRQDSLRLYLIEPSTGAIKTALRLLSVVHIARFHASWLMSTCQHSRVSRPSPSVLSSC